MRLFSDYSEEKFQEIAEKLPSYVEINYRDQEIFLPNNEVYQFKDFPFAKGFLPLFDNGIDNKSYFWINDREVMELCVKEDFFEKLKAMYQRPTQGFSYEGYKYVELWRRGTTRLFSRSATTDSNQESFLMMGLPIDLDNFEGIQTVLNYLVINPEFMKHVIYKGPLNTGDVVSLNFRPFTKENTEYVGSDFLVLKNEKQLFFKSVRTGEPFANVPVLRHHGRYEDSILSKAEKTRLARICQDFRTSGKT